MSIVFQVGVKALISDGKGRYLFVKRSEKKYPTIVIRGRWDLVGGRINPEEPLRTNLDREVLEEVGMRVVGEPKLLAAQDIFYDLKGVPQHVVRLTYAVEAEGEPKIDPVECEDFKQLSIEELLRLGEVDKYVKELIDAGVIS